MMIFSGREKAFTTAQVCLSHTIIDHHNTDGFSVLAKSSQYRVNDYWNILIYLVKVRIALWLNRAI